MPGSLQTVVICSPESTGGVSIDGVRVLCDLPDGQQGYLKETQAYLSTEPPSPSLDMSAEDGAIASGLIVSCWIAAYAVRSVIAVFRGSINNE